MRCPKCNKEVILHGVYCSECGYNYGKWLLQPLGEIPTINETDAESFSGEAIVIYQHDQIYNGTVIDGKPNGIGVMKMPDGKIISALWFDGEPLGDLVVYMPDGSRYVGSLLHNKRSGNALAYFPDGSYYDGAFQADAISGKGELFIANGDYYKGDFLNGKFHGVGTYQRKDKIYHGKFKNNVYEKTGKVFFDTADLYIFSNK